MNTQIHSETKLNISWPTTVRQTLWSLSVPTCQFHLNTPQDMNVLPQHRKWLNRFQCVLRETIKWTFENKQGVLRLHAITSGSCC